MLLSGRSLTSLAATGLGVRRLDRLWFSRSRAQRAGKATARPRHAKPQPGPQRRCGNKPFSSPASKRLSAWSVSPRGSIEYFAKVAGVYLERKPFGIAVHTRAVADRAHASELLEAAEHSAPTPACM